MTAKKIEKKTTPSEENKTSQEGISQDQEGAVENDSITQVKNAHASGLGSMGGYDEDLQNQPSNNSADDY